MKVPLSTRDLAVGYISKHTRSVVLEGLNLSVRTGELVCLVGPNGIGKSTLLRTLSRIQPALSGSIEIEGRDLEELRPIELASKLGVVLTERPVVGTLPVYRLVELGRYPHLSWLGNLGRHDRDVVQWAIEAVSADHLVMRDCSKLSDGERQRVMIARALAQEPSLLLLDEPTAFLDVPSRVELMGLLRRLAREQKLAIVVSTHDLELALRMADTLWVITPQGRLYSGAPEDIILAGGIREAFPSETIRFYPEERLFRPVAGAHASAVVHGEGLHAVLAEGVLEREGFEVVSDRSGVLEVSIDSRNFEWEAAVEERRHHGKTYAELAEFARGLIQARSGENGADTKL